MDDNLRAYMKMRDELLSKHHGKIAVFHKGKLVTIQTEIDKAIDHARKKTHGKDFFIKELYMPEEQASTIL